MYTYFYCIKHASDVTVLSEIEKKFRAWSSTWTRGFGSALKNLQRLLQNLRIAGESQHITEIQAEIHAVSVSLFVK